MKLGITAGAHSGWEDNSEGLKRMIRYKGSGYVIPTKEI